MKRILPTAHLSDLEFEKLMWPYRLLIPVMFIIGAYVQVKKVLYRCFGGASCTPKTNSWFFDGISINGRRVKDGSRRWPALEAVYNFHEGEGSNWLVRAVDAFWLNIRNAQAVRNRFRIVEWGLSAVISEIAKTKKGASIRILSLAAGSGQAVIEVIAQLPPSIRCEVIMIDNDQSAVEYAQRLAKEYGVDELVTVCAGDALSFSKHLSEGFTPDIVEMCGLMDYLDKRTAIALMRKIRQRLSPTGFFLTCHIHSNLERYFLRQVVNWDMLYRSRSKFKELLREGGFYSILHTEPQLIHSVAIAHKKP